MAIALSALVLLGGVFSPANAEDPPSFVMKWGTGGTGDGQFAYPMGLAVDNQNNIYVADNGNYRVQKFDSNGNFLFKLGCMGAGDGQLNRPMRVATDPTGNFVYVSDGYNSRVQKFDLNGNFLLKWGSVGTADGQFNQSEGIAVDSSGNVYVSDYNNSRIQKFDSSGNFLLKWGSLGSGDSQFYSAGGIPRGVAVDRNTGNVYVADTRNHRIQKFDSNGNFLLKWGGLGTGDGRVNTPEGVAVDTAGNVYVAERNGCRIQKFNSNGNFLSKWGSIGTDNGQFNNSTDVVLDSFGDIYVIEGVNNRIQKFSYTPITTRVISLSGNAAVSNLLNGKLDFGNVPAGTTKQLTLTISNNGNSPITVSSVTYPAAFTGDWSSGTIAVGSSQIVNVTFAPTLAQKYGGTLTVSCDKTGGANTMSISGSSENMPIFVAKWGTPGNVAGSGNGEFSWPDGLTVDNADNIYVADNHNARMQKIDRYGNFLLKWGNSGTSEGQFAAPQRIVTDSTGNFVYVADGSSNNRIQKFDRNGNFLLKWGSAGTGDGQFATPTGMKVDNAGNVWVSDYGNYRVQKFDSNGNFLFKFGGSSVCGDAKFMGADLDMDSAGNIYIVSGNLGYLHKFDSNGNFLLRWGSSGAGDGQFNGPTGVFFDKTTNTVYVAERNNYRVQKFDSNGNFLGKWGTQGTGDGQFTTPTDVAVDSFGDIYVTDTGNHRIQKFTYTPRRVIGLSGSLAFGSVQVGSTKQLTFTIGNTGNLPLTVSSITYPAGFTGSWSGTIAAGGSQSVTVTFAPTAAQSYSGTVTVNSDKTGGTETIAISGTGIPQTYTVTFQAGTNGAVTGSTSQTVNQGGSSTAVTAVPNTGYQFLNWTSPGGFTSTANPLTVTNVTANMTITANFQQVNAASFVTRTLPTCYTAGTGLTVTLKATPPTGTLNYMVEDSPPAGWTVSNISSPGTYDSINKKVKFIFYDGSAQTFTYDVTPPVSETGDKNFAGTALKDSSVRSDITGQTVVSQCSPYHPADNNPANYRLTMEEVSAYITAWQKGTLWNGVRISGSYVSRAGGLWQNGETYKYDPAAGTPPMCWLNTTLRSVRDNASSVIRKMPAYYEAGKAITVSLDVTPGGSGLFYTIEETPPDGWTVSDVSSPGSFDETNKIVTFYGNQAKTWSYKLTPPAGATGTKAFSAKSWFNGAEVAVTGIASVSDAEPATGDVNGDGKVDLADVILALQVVAGLNPPNVFSSADVNNDNRIGLEEVIYILQKVAGLR